MTRRELARRLQALVEADAGATCAVLLVRLQRLRDFRLIHGFSAGDALADAAQARIAEALRRDDRLHRLGDHEFALLLPRLHDENHALLAATRIARGFEQPLPLEGRALLAAVAVGGSVFPGHGEDAETLLRRAEHALDAAERGHERVRLYADGSERPRIPYEWLHDALADNRLDVFLQPILDLRSGAVGGAEALARWHEPEHGPIPPDAFIPLAEETGLIAGLTRWCVHASLRQAALAQQARPGFGVAVNLSPRVLGERDLVEQIASALDVWGIPAATLTLEITESALIEDPDTAIRVLRQLRELGIGIAIDDFGAGYSSFTYLRHLPATQLKIDRGFIAGMRSDPRSVQVVCSIVDLGHHLGLEVVAEGVEDARTLSLLRGLNCDHAQGTHIGLPVPAERLVATLGAAVAAR